jgi:hypothetical protein
MQIYSKVVLESGKSGQLSGLLQDFEAQGGRTDYIDDFLKYVDRRGIGITNHHFEGGKVNESIN